MNPTTHSTELDYEKRIRTSFERQQVMQLLGARLGESASWGGTYRTSLSSENYPAARLHTCWDHYHHYG